MSEATKMTEKQMSEYLELKRKSDLAKGKSKLTGERLRAKQTVLVRKAKEAGLTVTEAEIAAEMAREKK